MARIKIGDLLVKAGLIDEMQLQAGLAHQRQWGGKLGDALVANGFLDEMMLWKGLSRQLGVPLVSLPEHAFPPAIEKVVPIDLCRKHSIVPLSRDTREVVIATSEPNNIAGIDEVAFRVGARLRVVLAPDREVEWAVRRLYNGDLAPCPPPRLRRVLAEVDPAAALATQARGQVVDFGAQGPATPPSELPTAARSGAVPASFFPTAPPFAHPTTGAPAPTTGAPPLGGPFANAGASAVVNPFATGAAQPLASPFAAPPQAQASTLPRAASSTSMAAPPGGVPSPAAAPVASAAQTETVLRETSVLLRYVVEACIARGIFTRDEYVARVRAQP